jgi:kynureninase
MDKLISKSKQLTGYLEFLLLNGKRKDFKIITPADEAQRGCQLSIVMDKDGKITFDALTQNGVIADWREPDVIRVAPVPMYNSFTDVFRFAEIFNNV